MEETNPDFPHELRPYQRIALDLQRYIQSMIDSKCDLWNVESEKVYAELAALRREWIAEHQNLIQIVDSNESNRIKDAQTDKEHFERINSLQVRLDKLTETHCNKIEVDQVVNVAILQFEKIQLEREKIFVEKINASKRYSSAAIAGEFALGVLFVVAFLSHIMGTK